MSETKNDCAILIKKEDIKFLKHEKFENVYIARLVGSKTNDRISVSLLRILQKHLQMYMYMKMKLILFSY